MNIQTKYPRYQDYVICDGRLVGEFEEMYRDFDDPWEQSIHEPRALDKSIGLALLKKYGHQRVLEYGCGFGHFTAQLHHELGAAAGVDISSTAISKAKQRFPSPTFFVGDVLDVTPLNTFMPDAIVFAEITWYVLDKLSLFKKLLLENCEGKGFVHILTTYPEGQQRYGKAHFSNLEEIRAYWADTIDVLEWGWVSHNEASGVARTIFYGKIRHG